MKNNQFEKEYMTGRRDQFDLDLNTFWECVEKTETREELIEIYRKEMSATVSRLARDRAKTLREQIETDD
jgi:hypothetical protein